MLYLDPYKRVSTTRYYQMFSQHTLINFLKLLNTASDIRDIVDLNTEPINVIAFLESLKEDGLVVIGNGWYLTQKGKNLLERGL